ncbi:ribosomal RNA small subunit methyltransferase H [Deltaproteobacteria bacterium]|nr:ribosomal RNA small subunit methyltransferase H [Deltaproteobacteria bacterium]
MSQADFAHLPVLPEAVLEYLSPRDGRKYLDGTIGLGGHTGRILASANCRVLGLDRDEEALAIAGERLAPFGDRVILRHSRFSNAAKALDELGWDKIDGALLDIGVSSLQLDTPRRGFSFKHNGPLDMRMDADGTGAADFVNTASFACLKECIETDGEEPLAGRIARAIMEAREHKAISTTEELAKIVEAAYPAKWRHTAKNHPATRTFQALRIQVNDELGELRAFLTRIVPYLAPQARLLVISFHSLEDRIVKQFFRDEAAGCRCPKHVPVCICNHMAALSIVTKKPLMAGEEEVRRNPRAGSAKLRVAEKLPETGRERA